MALYAAYGSNMNAGLMRERCPSSPMVSTGYLMEWRLTFGGDDVTAEGSLATIVPDVDSSVFVVLYEVSEADRRSLDSWEGADLGWYDRLRLRIHTLDGDVLAWTYALRAFEGGLPSAHYLGLVAQAAEEAGAPADYVRDLRLRPCRSNRG